MPILVETAPDPLPADRYPRVRFVDAPTPDATVRFDFNAAGTWADDDTWPEHDGFSLGVPMLEGEPDGIGVEYGLRDLTFNLVIKGTRMVALAQQSKLAREILRRDNWLLFQLDEYSKPVWFKTYRSQPGELSFEWVDTDDHEDMWGLGVSLSADAFALGETVTAPVVTVANNPTAATNPMSFTLSDIAGDAPAPALVKIGWSANRHGFRHLLASTPVGHTAPIVWQVGSGDSWTAGTDMGAGTADAAYSGGSYRTVSFATDATMVTRLSGVAPVAVPPGRYKVLARLGRSDTSSTFAVRMGVKVVFSERWGDTQSITWGLADAAGHRAWVDLGDFPFPAGVTEISDTEPTVTPEVAFQAQRVSGTGSLRVDAFLLVPVGDNDARTLFVNNDSVGPTASGGSPLIFEHHDGDIERVYQRGAVSGTLRPMYPPRLSGGFPILVPGEANTLYLVSQTSPSKAKGLAGDVPDDITSTAQVTVSYQPRFLYLAGE